MKSIITILLFLTTSISFAQKTKDILKEIDGKYQVDDNGNVSFIKVIDVSGLTKDALYDRAINYFIYNYGDANSVLQTKDRDAGLIIGKGVYKDVHSGAYTLFSYATFNTWHIIRVDIKEGRARIVLSITNYDEITKSGNYSSSTKLLKVSNEYPVNPKGSKGHDKTFMIRAFYQSYLSANKTLEALEKAIKEGSTSKSIENSDW